jgi:hypothetical protein
VEGGAPQESAQGRKGAGSYSGRLLLRMPQALHEDLARASERAGVSLNGYINEALGRAVGRRATATPAAPAPARRRGRRRLVERLLLVNLVVVAVVGVLVIVLLVQALR